MSKQFKRLSTVFAKSFGLSTEQLEASFRLATIEEVQTVSSMRRRVFGCSIKDDDERYLKWRYYSHPGFSSTLWVFEYRGEVIGAMGTEPVELLNCGCHQSAIRSMDAIVEPEFDNRGLGAWMVLALQEHYSCILVCGGNANSMSMLKKLFVALPIQQRYKMMFRSNAYLKHKMSPVIAGMLTPIVNILLTVYHRLKWRQLSTPEGIEIRSVGHIDELIKLLPEAPGILGTVKVHRSGEYLAWRYRDNPRAEFLVKGAFKQGQLLGFAIYSYCPAVETGGVNLGQIVEWDIFSSAASVEVLSALYLKVVQHFKGLGAEQIVMTLNDKTSADAAKEIGFSLREVHSSFFVYQKDAQPDDPIFSANLWYQSISDSDTEGI